jgi:hypothetical protein
MIVRVSVYISASEIAVAVIVSIIDFDLRPFSFSFSCRIPFLSNGTYHTEPFISISCGTGACG